MPWNNFGALAHIDMDASFPAARTRLFAHPYDWLVTNVRLDAYNGHARSKAERDRAALASGRCLTSDGRYAEALTVLSPLLK